MAGAVYRLPVAERRAVVERAIRNRAWVRVTYSHLRDETTHTVEGEPLGVAASPNSNTADLLIVRSDGILRAISLANVVAVEGRS